MRKKIVTLPLLVTSLWSRWWSAQVGGTRFKWCHGGDGLSSSITGSAVTVQVVEVGVLMVISSNEMEAQVVVLGIPE